VHTNQTLTHEIRLNVLMCDVHVHVVVPDLHYQGMEISGSGEISFAPAKLEVSGYHNNMNIIKQSAIEHE
jgi:hypothetical protein